jgi:DNA-binding CsgD family transcriptional regulator
MAKVALKFALGNQGLIRALVLWNCDPRTPQYGAYGSGRRLARSNWNYQIETSARTTFPQDDYDVQRRMKAELMTPDDFLVTLDALDEEVPDTELAGLKVDTLVLATRASAWSFAAEEPSRRLASLIPGARLAIFDDVGGGLFSLEDAVPPAIGMIREFVLRARQSGDASGGSPLSAREREVMRLVCSGNSNFQIADELGVSRNTVRRHVANILAKLGATNRTQAVAYVRDQGLL